MESPRLVCPDCGMFVRVHHTEEKGTYRVCYTSGCNSEYYEWHWHNKEELLTVEEYIIGLFFGFAMPKYMLICNKCEVPIDRTVNHRKSYHHTVGNEKPLTFKTERHAKDYLERWSLNTIARVELR